MAPRWTMTEWNSLDGGDCMYEGCEDNALGNKCRPKCSRSRRPGVSKAGVWRPSSRRNLGTQTPFGTLGHYNPDQTREQTRRVHE
eukprot:1318986-Amorphochlora_amoeboformis.AAC.1